MTSWFNTESQRMSASRVATTRLVVAVVLVGLLGLVPIAASAQDEEPFPVTLSIDVFDTIDLGMNAPVTLLVSGLLDDDDTDQVNYTYRIDIVDSNGDDADACEGWGMNYEARLFYNAADYMLVSDAGPKELYAATSDTGCAYAASYTVKASLSNSGGTELAAATASFEVLTLAASHSGDAPKLTAFSVAATHKDTGDSLTTTSATITTTDTEYVITLPACAASQVVFDWTSPANTYVYVHRSGADYTSGTKSYFRLHLQDVIGNRYDNPDNYKTQTIWVGDVTTYGVFVTDHKLSQDASRSPTALATYNPVPPREEGVLNADYRYDKVYNLDDPPHMKSGEPTARVPTNKVTDYKFTIKAPRCDNEGRTTITANCATSTPTPGKPGVSTSERFRQKSIRVAFNLDVPNSGSRPFSGSTQDSAPDSACNNPESWQVWFSHTRELLAQALTDSADARTLSDTEENNKKSYVSAYDNAYFAFEEGSLHHGNPADVVQGVKGNLAEPFPLNKGTDLPDELPTVLNSGLHIYYAARVNFTELDLSNSPTTKLKFAGEWSDIGYHHIRLDNSHYGGI